MVFEPKFTKVVSSVRKNLGTTQSVIEVKLPTNDIEVKNVYSVGAKSTILHKEFSGREIVFSGLVDFQAIYNSESINALDYTAEFKDRFLIDKDVCGELIVTSNVIDINSMVSNQGIRVVAIVETNIDEICSKDINVLTSVDSDDSHVATFDVTYSTYLGRAYEKFDVMEDIRIDRVKNILMVTPCVSLSSVDPRENYIVISGKVNLDICYLTGDNISDIANHFHEVDFTTEVAFDGVNTNSAVQSVIGMLNNEIKVSTTIEDGVANLNVFMPIVYSGYIFEENRVLAVEDLYLERNYLSITCENFYTITRNNSINFKDNISGTATILDTAPFIDEVLGVATSNIVIAGSRIQDDRLCLEGVANATVMYYTKETNEITATQVEMPFAVEQKVDAENVDIVSICLQKISARSKRGKEIEVSAEISVYADLYGMRSECVISEVTLGEEKQPEDCSLYIYVVKPNQTIWDVAKDTSVSQELIIEQNPQVELPIKAGDKLVIYRPNIMKF